MIWLHGGWVEASLAGSGADVHFDLPLRVRPLGQYVGDQRRHSAYGRIPVPGLNRRSISFAALLGAALGALCGPTFAHAQAWPSGTIRIIVPYPPAGSTDVIARLVQPELQQRLGATVIIENRAGASGSVGTAAVAKSPPDGNSWLIVFDNHAANPFVLGNLPYDTEKDLDPVLLIGTAPYAV